MGSAGGLAALLGQTRENATLDRRQASLLALCYLSPPAAMKRTANRSVPRRIVRCEDHEYGFEPLVRVVEFYTRKWTGSEWTDIRGVGMAAAACSSVDKEESKTLDL